MTPFKVTLIIAALFLCGLQLSIGRGIPAVTNSSTGIGNQQSLQTLKAGLTDFVSESYRTSKFLIDARWAKGTIDRLAREEEVDALNQWAKTTRQKIREGDDFELMALSQAVFDLKTGSVTDADLPPFFHLDNANHVLNGNMNKRHPKSKNIL